MSDTRNEFSQEEIHGAVSDVELIVQQMQEIRTTPEAKAVFEQLREKKEAIGEIFSNCPPARSAYRFRRLMDQVKEGEHFGHYGKAIERALQLGRIREATETEVTEIISCLRDRRRLPLLTVSYRKVWYVLTKPELKTSQALMFVLRDLYYRAKKTREAEKGQTT